MPDSDQSRRAFLSTARPEDIQVEFITPSRDGEKQVKVTIKGKPVSRHENNNPTLVPHFLQLAQVGTKFSTQMQGDKRNNTLSTTLLPGDEENNRLWHRHSKDSLKGKGGADRYQVHAGAREVEIDNQDHGSENDGEIAQDIAILPWDFEDMRIAQQGQDVVLTHASDPHSHPTVRIKQFMQHKNNRHLWLQDKNGIIDELQVTAENQLLFYGLGEEAKPVHQEAALASSLLLEAMSGFAPSRRSSPDLSIPALFKRVDLSAASLSIPTIIGDK